MAEIIANISRSLIVGASGQVGTQMLRFLTSEFGAKSALPTRRAAQENWLRLDLADLAVWEDAAKVLDKEAVERIFCFGGMTNVDRCEDDPDLAQRTNARGPAALSSYARRRGLPFTYFSTEYVFDGSRENPGPYTEDATPSPLNTYGQSKLDGEHAVLDAHPSALVIRTTVVYGPDQGQKNYLYAIMRNLSEGTAMRVPMDQVSTPTYNRDLIHITLGLMERKASGIFHVCGPELMGRLEFARSVAKRFSLDHELLQGVSTLELNQRARRPLDAGLATTKLNSLYPELRMRSLAEALDDAAPELEEFLIQRALCR